MHAHVQWWLASTQAYLLQRAPCVADSVCTNFRKQKNSLLLGNHLASHFLLEGGGSLCPCQQLESQVLITPVPTPLSKAPTPGLPFSMGLIRGHNTHALSAP